VTKKLQAFLLALLLGVVLLPHAQAQSFDSSTLVVVNSAQWQDAVTASSFARVMGYQFAYFLGTETLSQVSEAVLGYKASSVILFDSDQSELPGVSVSLRAMGQTVNEYPFASHDDLAQIVLSLMHPQNVILVRDDFAADAISSTYLSQVTKSPILFSNSLGGPTQELQQSLITNNVEKVYAIGGVDTSALPPSMDVVPINGADQFATSQLVNSYADQIAPPGPQSYITIGDIVESTVFDSTGSQVFMVPADSLYSLPQLAKMLNTTGTKALVGIGLATNPPGTYLQQATNDRFVIKAGHFNPPDEQSFVQENLQGPLPGYPTPQIDYSYNLSSVAVSIGNLYDVTTGHFLFFDLFNSVQKSTAAPPVILEATLDDNGNVQIPVQVFFTVTDTNGNVITTLQGPTTTLEPEIDTVVSAFWANPPSTGNYNLQVRTFANVYGGLSQNDTAPFLVDWDQVYLSIGLLLLFLIIVLTIGWFAMRSREQEKEEVF
jgi:hypothetical protein